MTDKTPEEVAEEYLKYYQKSVNCIDLDDSMRAIKMALKAEREANASKLANLQAQLVSNAKQWKSFWSKIRRSRDLTPYEKEVIELTIRQVCEVKIK